MRKIRELLRLKYELGRSHRDLGRSLGIANSTVSDRVGTAPLGRSLASQPTLSRVVAALGRGKNG